ncbi:MAG: mechanosensitive ion channel family protein [Synoicihabitans sp.]
MLLTLSLPEGSAALRIVTILAVAAGAHIIVALLKWATRRAVALENLERRPKVRSILGLATSTAVFAIYFTAIGFALGELGISLKAYFASATVIGLAVGFGSQGLVQDIVTGLTLVFSDLIDIDDMVEISGQTGRVKTIGMRFVVLQNTMGALVYIPNRSIGNVINYPKGYIRCLIDITLPADPTTRSQIEAICAEKLANVSEQHPGILLAPPSIEGIRKTSRNKEYLRLKLRIWPSRGAPLETVFKAELVQALRAIDSSFTDWMVTVFFETERALPAKRTSKTKAAG